MAHIKPNKACDYCEVKETDNKFDKCSACKCTYYCSQECQKKDWSIHKKICSNRSFIDETRKLIEIMFHRGVYHFIADMVNTYDIVNFFKFAFSYENTFIKTRDLFEEMSKCTDIRQKIIQYRGKTKKVDLEVLNEVTLIYQSYMKTMKEDVGIVQTPSTYEKWKEEINNFNILDKITRMDKTYIKRGKMILKIENGILTDERTKEVNDAIDKINRDYTDKFIDIIKYIEKNKKQSSIHIDKVTLYLTDSYIECHCIIDGNSVVNIHAERIV